MAVPASDVTFEQNGVRIGFEESSATEEALPSRKQHAAACTVLNTALFVRIRAAGLPDWRVPTTSLTARDNCPVGSVTQNGSRTPPG